MSWESMSVQMSRYSGQTLGIEETLGVGRGARSIFTRWWFWLLILLGAGLIYYMFFIPAPKTRYVTQAVERGPLAEKVDATGSLEPLDKVTVGAEISGRIDEVLVDFNDSVVTGQVLARINKDDLTARATQARASLASARASLAQAEATAADAKRAFTRLESLRETGFASNAAYDTAKANMEKADAAVQGARAQVMQAEAQLQQAETNLAKTEIKSPIDGVVLDRKVEPGQTVQANFQAPELFVIASDLRRMELQVYIDEADIARVKPGQDASFTVDAYDEKTFPAKVERVRTSPRILANVVAYLATLSVNNAQGLLRPGLTANAEIITARAENVLHVPNAALRFEPETKRNPGGGSGVSVSIGGRGGPNVRPSGGAPPKDTPKKDPGIKTGTVYVLSAAGDPEKRDLVLGITDGIRTEVKSGPLKLGDKVITDIELPNAKPAS
jgi:HlyD family secretion protein